MEEKTQAIVCGGVTFQTLTWPDGAIEVWDEEWSGHIFTFHDVKIPDVELSMQLYQKGFNEGEKWGEVKMQSQIRALLGIKE